MTAVLSNPGAQRAPLQPQQEIYTPGSCRRNPACRSACVAPPNLRTRKAPSLKDAHIDVACSTQLSKNLLLRRVYCGAPQKRGFSDSTRAVSHRSPAQSTKMVSGQFLMLPNESTLVNRSKKIFFHQAARNLTARISLSLRTLNMRSTLQSVGYTVCLCYLLRFILTNT